MMGMCFPPVGSVPVTSTQHSLLPGLLQLVMEWHLPLLLCLMFLLVLLTSLFRLRVVSMFLSLMFLSVLWRQVICCSCFCWENEFSRRWDCLSAYWRNRHAWSDNFSCCAGVGSVGFPRFSSFLRDFVKTREGWLLHELLRKVGFWGIWVSCLRVPWFRVLLLFVVFFNVAEGSAAGTSSKRRRRAVGSPVYGQYQGFSTESKNCHYFRFWGVNNVAECSDWYILYVVTTMGRLVILLDCSLRALLCWAMLLRRVVISKALRLFSLVSVDVCAVYV